MAEAGINPDYPTVFFAHGYLAGPESVESKTMRKGACVFDDCVTFSRADHIDCQTPPARLFPDSEKY
jgi:hypothetical protein